MIITSRNWKQFSSDIAYPADPIDYNQEAVDRLMDKMDDHVVRVKGVKPQFKATNAVNVIPFLTPEGRKFYEEAMERYKKRKAKAEQRKSEGYSVRTEILVALLMFRIAAESNPDRAEHIARAMYESVTKYDKAAASAWNFRISMSKVIHLLLTKYKVPRSMISVIWGGSQVNQSKKKKAKKAIIGNEELMERLEAEGIDMESIGLGEDVEIQEEIPFDSGLRLGSQSREQRQEEIDRFQKGISRYCLFSFKAGGVGLSLHHTDTMTQFKCRRKESGYVYEEDIPLVSTRPRELFCAPTYSAIELVQGLGRCPRLTSMSDTLQWLIFFRGTIEERVAAITKMKLRCLSKVVRQRESWEDIIDQEDSEVSDRLQIAANEMSEDEDNGMILSDHTTESDE